MTKGEHLIQFLHRPSKMKPAVKGSFDTLGWASCFSEQRIEVSRALLKCFWCEQLPRWLLLAWFHPERVPEMRWRQCHQRPGALRFDDYQPRPRLEELVRMPLEHALDQLLEDLLADQLAHGPRVHHSEPYCFACTMEHIDLIFQGAPELAGLKAVAAMQRLSGHPGVAVLQDTRTSTNAMLITLEQTPEALFRQIEHQVP
jgi:hypothetical protein